MRTLNSLYDDCRNLWAGATLCLPAPCTTYVVQSGDTCSSIANETSNSFSQILAYNPVLDNYCSNLIAGESICVSPPGGAPTLTTIPGNTVTQTAVYGSTTAARPSPVATGTTHNCAKYYLVQPGDYCQLVSLNQTVDLGLFQSMNPQIDSACDNLLSGFYYCVMPIQGWNSTTSSSVVTAPTATPSGTTSNCYEYYTIQSGDYCGKVEDMFSITFLQFQYWNPDIKADFATQTGAVTASNVDKRYVALDYYEYQDLIKLQRRGLRNDNSWEAFSFIPLSTRHMANELPQSIPVQDRDKSLSFIRRMLSWLSEERAPAKELKDDPWFTVEL
ncbi:hypothetical protein DV735_g1270, partial [Chaetothyriales sp. CBS 134920]